MARHGMIIDLGRCIGCHACVVACKNWHGDEPGEPGRIVLVELTEGTFPDVTPWFIPVMCMHCDNPACVPACPQEALGRGADGVVVVNGEKCTGCGECAAACPFGAIAVNEREGKAVKCDLCGDRLKTGLMPVCAQSCPGGAMQCIDLDDGAAGPWSDAAGPGGSPQPLVSPGLAGVGYRRLPERVRVLLLRDLPAGRR